MVNAAFLANMLPTAYLINTSRGGTVDEAALIHALQTGVIAGAGLDVFETEPTPADNPLRRLPNVYLTPHAATNNEECIRAGFEGIIKCLKEYESGQVPEFCLNPDYVNHR
jgi:phosphoglycerate dehydrogenase-like enzyme